MDFTSTRDDFLVYLEMERGMSINTVNGYRCDLNLFSRFLSQQAFKSTQWSVLQIKRPHIRAFLKFLKEERNNSAYAINRKIAALSGYFNFLVREYSLQENPMANIARLKEEKKLPQFLDLHEAGKLLDTIKQCSSFPERDFAIFTLFLQTGCRLSELTELTLDQLRLQERHIRFQGKGKKERLIPLTETTCSAIKNWLKERSPTIQTNRVFLNRYGRPLGKRGIQSNLERFLQAAGLYRPGLSVHKLRHTCLTLLLKSGVNIKTLKEIAGHTSISTTEIYTHVNQEEMVEGMNKHPLIKENLDRYKTFLMSSDEPIIVSEKETSSPPS